MIRYHSTRAMADACWCLVTRPEDAVYLRYQSRIRGRFYTYGAPADSREGSPSDCPGTKVLRQYTVARIRNHHEPILGFISQE